MITHNYAGSILFRCDRVFIMKNEEGIWNFPRRLIVQGDVPAEVATAIIQKVIGISPEIIYSTGDLYNDFFKVPKRKDLDHEDTWYIRPVCNKVTWFIMSSNERYCEENLAKYVCGFYPVDMAEKMLESNQDISLLNIAYKKVEQILKL